MFSWIKKWILNNISKMFRKNAKQYNVSISKERSRFITAQNYVEDNSKHYTTVVNKKQKIDYENSIVLTLGVDGIIYEAPEANSTNLLDKSFWNDKR